MKKRKIIIILIIFISIIAILSGLIFRKGHEPFDLDTKDKYIVETPMKVLTMENDGGSHTNIYYEVDLEKNIIYKREDLYKGFKGYVYKGMLTNKKKLSEIESDKLRSLFNSIIANRNENQEKISNINFNYYKVSTAEYKDIKVSNEETIKQLKEFLD